MCGSKSNRSQNISRSADTTYTEEQESITDKSTKDESGKFPKSLSNVPLRKIQISGFVSFLSEFPNYDTDEEREKHWALVKSHAEERKRQERERSTKVDKSERLVNA